MSSIFFLPPDIIFYSFLVDIMYFVDYKIKKNVHFFSKILILVCGYVHAHLFLQQECSIECV